jgi:hypothetical protein
MEKTLSLLTLSFAALSLASCAYSEPATSLPPGQYEHTSKSVDQEGTVHSQESSTEVYYDEYGHKQSSVQKKTTTNPKGLFNKRSTESSSTTE